jgi:hypothetical protein
MTPNTAPVRQNKTHFNQLSPAEAERLAILAEECAEVIQVVGKILRHGYDSFHPGDAGRTTNRALLENEIGHVRAITQMMVKGEDVCDLEIQKGSLVKLERVDRYLHHNQAPKY